jgi:signal transduction histidine kinase
MLERLQSAFESQDRFIADVSHELKTPVTELVAEASILRHQAPSTSHIGFCAAVQERLQHLAEVVDGLLTLAHAESASLSVTFVPMDFNQLVSEVADRCRPAAVRNEVTIITRLLMPDSGVPAPMVNGDPSLLAVAVTNVLRNAIRHSPRGGSVGVTISVEDKMITLRIDDSGPGIPPAYRDHVFERFFRVPADPAQPSRRRGGTGLGLAIAKVMVVLHDGTIAASNRPEGGCEITIRLPAFASK